MNDATDKDRLFIAKCSLVLFIVGLLVPFIILVILDFRETELASETKQNIQNLAFGFCAIAEVLAVVLGFAGQRHLSGKIGMFGPIVVFVLVIALVIWEFLGSSGPQEFDAPSPPVVAEELPPKGLPVEPPVQPEEQPRGDEQAP